MTSKKVEPIPADGLAFLQSVDSPTLANAIEVFNVRERSEGYIGGNVKSLFPDLGVMVGRALTVKVSNEPGSDAGRDGFWQMFEAVAAMPAPVVIVMQDVSGEPHRCAYAGEVMARMARRLGAVGMVTDGGYRDLAEVRALDFHLFSQYVVVSHGNFAIHEVGDPVFIDGQHVSTGDILHGDANGIVVVPDETLAELPEAVAGIRERESKLMTYIETESFDLAKARSGKGY